ncbi:hypothetical protein [Streptomyces omiyaensis]|uniref:DUF3592 domain-containing protein n=1 Tax=Streptomyces omiyaensis TaxID=68247 RepID=A0ABW7BK77_9ACTN|nr:hypothetical protein [Streptomyces omiyaensis]GGY30708.1 hypothetical protein GCM10010363_09140 [Streptomyces omiyaensis]
MGKGRVLAYAGAVTVPLGSGALLHLWGSWSMRSPLGTPAALAVLVALVLAGLAVAAHHALFREGGSVLALVLLLAGLGAVWIEARDSRVRGATVECVVVGKVRVTDHPTFGEGAPEPKRLYHHALDCPGGHPREFAWERKLGGAGETVAIAYDPARRMDPVPADENVARGSLFLPGALLLLAAGLSVAALAVEGTDDRIR